MSPRAHRWVTIQWAMLGVAAVGMLLVAFYLSGGLDSTPIHGG